MIAAAVGLLVVALILLLVGIGKSSVAPLVVSLLATLGACGLLAASWNYYRRGVGADSDAGEATGGDGWDGADAWDELSATDAAALARTYGFDELQAARAHEVANGYRKTVLKAIDARLEEIVMTRRRIG